MRMHFCLTYTETKMEHLKKSHYIVSPTSVLLSTPKMM